VARRKNDVKKARAGFSPVSPFTAGIGCERVGGFCGGLEICTFMSGPEILKFVLTRFWSRFGDRRKSGVGFEQVDKLRALRELSFVVIPYKAQKILPKRRKQFDESKLKLHPFRRFGICFVCGQPANDRHHIIQLQNGGINSKKNLVSLCCGCHGKIHPWM
jgi:hypothetical protein